MRIKCGKAVGELTSLPGCAQVVVSHNVFIPEPERDTGLGTTAGKERIKLCQELGYNLMLCTCRSTNRAQQSVLLKCGWTQLTEFHSDYTDRNIQLWSKHL